MKTGPFEIRPAKSLNFKCFQILNGWISDPHCSKYYSLGLEVDLISGDPFIWLFILRAFVIILDWNFFKLCLRCTALHGLTAILKNNEFIQFFSLSFHNWSQLFFKFLIKLNLNLKYGSQNPITRRYFFISRFLKTIGHLRRNAMHNKAAN